MEFSECRKSTHATFCICADVLSFQLTLQLLEADPLKRIAFVAAFAMSNYSSSIGRIAKPFNPMLVSMYSTAV